MWNLINYFTCGGLNSTLVAKTTYPSPKDTIGSTHFKTKKIYHQHVNINLHDSVGNSIPCFQSLLINGTIPFINKLVILSNI